MIRTILCKMGIHEERSLREWDSGIYVVHCVHCFKRWRKFSSERLYVSYVDEAKDYLDSNRLLENR